MKPKMHSAIHYGFELKVKCNFISYNLSYDERAGKQ